MPTRRFCYSLGVAVSILWGSAPALANTAADAAPSTPSSQQAARSADSASGPTSSPLVLSERMHLEASPEQVWAAVRDFGSPELWIPDIKATNLLQGEDNQPGARRQITRQDDRTLVEQLLAWDGSDKRLTYRMIHGWLPVTHYKSTLAVQPDDDSGSYVVWEARFQPGGGQTAESARQAVQQYYVTALQNLRSMLSTSGASEAGDTDNNPQ